MAQKQKVKSKKVDPLRAMPRPEVAPDPLSIGEWSPHSVRGWMATLEQVQEINGRPYSAGWLLEKGIPRGWIIVPVYGLREGHLGLEMHLSWLTGNDIGDGAFQRFLGAAESWRAETAPVANDFGELLLQVLRDNEITDPERVATALGVLLAFRSLERRNFLKKI